MGRDVVSTPYGQQPGPWGEQHGATPRYAPGYPQGYSQGYQQGYQQQGYGQWTGGRPARQRPGIVGLALAVAGAVLLILGFTALDWYSGAGTGIKFSDLHDAASNASGTTLETVYFGWLGWVLLALVIICAVAANLPLGAAAGVLRIITPILGVAGIALTLFALNRVWDAATKAYTTASSQFSDVEAADFGVFKHSAVGLYITLAGFLVAGVAGIFGPRRG